MEVSVTAAMGHIQNFIHPQVVIVDYPSREDGFFNSGVQHKARELGIPVIDLHTNEVGKLMWITRLDSGSLQGRCL